MSKFLILVALVFVILVAGCLNPAPEQAVPTPTPQVIYVTVTVTPTAAVTAEISPLTTSKYVYERGGKYYHQPLNFVCTESNPTHVMMFESGNLTDPHQYIWCEQGDLVNPPD